MTQFLHFVIATDEQRAIVVFCCESQPLATVRTHGYPKRCPFCQQGNPVSSSLTNTEGGSHKERI